MNLTTARSWARQFSRNAGDSTMYTDADVDRAIQTVADRFIVKTRCLKTVSSIALSQGVAAASLAGIPTFRPDRLVGAYLSTVATPLMMVDYETYLASFVTDASQGVPTAIAFETPSTCYIWHTPNAAYTLRLRWTDFFTPWTPGGADPGTLNLADDFLRGILSFGVPATLQHNEPEHKYASATWQRYLEFEKDNLSAGSTGARVMFRNVGA